MLRWTPEAAEISAALTPGRSPTTRSTASRLAPRGARAFAGAAGLRAGVFGAGSAGGAAALPSPTSSGTAGGGGAAALGARLRDPPARSRTARAASSPAPVSACSAACRRSCSSIAARVAASRSRISFSMRSSSSLTVPPRLVPAPPYLPLPAPSVRDPLLRSEIRCISGTGSLGDPDATHLSDPGGRRLAGRRRRRAAHRLIVIAAVALVLIAAFNGLRMLSRDHRRAATLSRTAKVSGAAAVGEPSATVSVGPARGADG